MSLSRHEEFVRKLQAPLKDYEKGENAHQSKTASASKAGNSSLAYNAGKMPEFERKFNISFDPLDGY